MQKLLDTCYEYGEKYCLSFNFKKTKTIVFGKKLSECVPLHLNGSKIEFVQEWKYLGTTLRRIDSHPFIVFSCSADLAKFYRASNAVLNAVRKPSENVLMHLLFTNCVSILTYAADVKEYPSREMGNLNTAINNCIRRIFSFSSQESVRELRSQFGYRSIYEMFVSRKDSFLRNIQRTRNNVLIRLKELTD